ncbi:MAG: phage terminase large subunit [Methanotrichaceae archaeon]|jgi:predicted phage terminase large subunit-like protein|nr:phage terminase large subunit [Methanotrichaceae archaeon]
MPEILDESEAERPLTVSRKSLRIGSFCDLATSTKTRADFTVMATVGMDKALNVYILSILRGRWEWPDAYEHIVDEIGKQKVSLVGVETNGFQLSSFQELIRDSRLKGVAFHAVPMSTDKTSRALLVSSKGSNGKLYYAAGASWSEYMITEFVNFPGFRHDDVVDAVCGAVELVNRYSPASVTRPGVAKRQSKWRRSR